MMKDKLKLRTVGYCCSIIPFQVITVLYYAFKITYQKTMQKDKDYDYSVTFNATLVLFTNILLQCSNTE